ncbi:MAG: hypothetical protein RLZZ488_1421 [Pseudomonadota bacterium]
MKKRLLIIGDPIDKLNFASDSSLAFAEGFLALGHNVYWTTSEEIGLINGTPMTASCTEIISVESSLPPVMGIPASSSFEPLSSFSHVLIRKDPPFDLSYVDLCWILSQKTPSHIINSPHSLLNFHEKLTPWNLAAEGIVPQHMMVPTIVSSNRENLQRFAEEQFSLANHFLGQFAELDALKGFKFQLLCKPWRGHGGRGIHTFSSTQSFSQWLIQQATVSDRTNLQEPVIVQPLLPEIHSHGDRRVFIVNGEVVFDFVRWPAKGKIEANLAQGGSATLEEMPDELRHLCRDIAIYLRMNNILLAGLDFIGSRLTEVNITSPTGIRTFEQLSGKKITTDIARRLLGEQQS